MVDCHAVESQKGRASVVMQICSDRVGVVSVFVSNVICRVCVCRNQLNFTGKQTDQLKETQRANH